MITRLRVKNFKSLKDVDLRLQPLNVFVGPNGSGKSNIFDALQLLSDLVNQGAGALHSRGTFDELVWNGDASRVISIAIEGSLDKKNKYEYQIQIAGTAKIYAIAAETFTLNPTTNPIKLLEFDPRKVTASYYDITGQIIAQLAVGQVSGSMRTATTVLGETPLPSFIEDLSQWRRFQFTTDVMKELPVARRELRMGSHGENFALVLHTLQTEDPDRFQRLTKLLQVILPSLQSISTPLTEQGRSYIRIRE
ncbi:MAG: AAA family ATPase [Chloroflexi bacterium]|nr:AAA family ATPase [Chloroflexota bacterium]